SALRVENVPCDRFAEGVTLFTHTQWDGVCSTFTADDPDLSDNYVGNDSTWSLRIRGPYQVTLYRDPNWTGTSVSYSTDSADLGGSPIGSGASSLRVTRLPCNPVAEG